MARYLKNKYCIFVLLFPFIGLMLQSCDNKDQNHIDDPFVSLQEDLGGFTEMIKIELQVDSSKYKANSIYIHFKELNDPLVLNLNSYFRNNTCILVNASRHIVFGETESVKKMILNNYLGNQLPEMDHLCISFFFCLNCFELDKAFHLKEFNECIEEISIQNSNIDSFIVESPEKYTVLREIDLIDNPNLHYLDTEIYNLPRLKVLNLQNTMIKKEDIDESRFKNEIKLIF